MVNRKCLEMNQSATETSFQPRMTQPRMSWVTVTDAQGRERLQARWSDPTSVAKAGAVQAA